MSTQTFTEAITADMVEANNQSRFTGSQFSGLKANGLLLNVILRCKSTDDTDLHLEDLESIYVNVNIRRRGADGVQVCDNVRLIDALAYSDFTAGVSSRLSLEMGHEVDPNGSVIELAGYLSMGFFSLGIDESVEVLISGRPKRTGWEEIQINGRWVYLADTQQRLFGYKSFRSVGGEQAYRDVQGIFYLGIPQEKNATIRDYTGSQSVNLRDAVALANATGRFEIFSNFGILYTDPTGFSQDVSISLEGDENLFMFQEFFSLNKLVEGDGKMLREQEAVLQNIYATRKEKFDVLRQKGQIPAGFTPALG